MKRNPIPIDDLSMRPLHVLSKQWMLLCAGDYKEGKFNAMTIGWGSFGTIK
jgi:hypothetical protein